MLKHIVIWKLKDFAEGAGKEENARILKDRLEGLKQVIKEINSLEVGVNTNDSPDSYDLALYSEFETRSDFESYQKHPEHVKVGEFISKVRLERIVVDYEA